MAFLNPERVERQGGQNQLYERSIEKGFSKEKLEEETEGKISLGFFGIGPISEWPSRQAQKHSKRPEGTWLRKNISPKPKMNERVRG